MPDTRFGHRPPAPRPAHNDGMTVPLKFSGASKNLTFDELEKFVHAARRAGVVGKQPVTAVVSTTGKLKQLQVLLDEE